MDWTQYWFNTSEHNAVDREKGKARKVMLHDTTLRDGEQTPGVVFNEDDKVAIGAALSEYGVDRIEIMPVVSDDDFRATKRLVDMHLKAEIIGFCRSAQIDIDKCLEAGVKSVVIEIQTYPDTLKVVGWSTDDAIEKMVTASNYAKEKGMRVTMFFPIAAHSKFEYFKDVMTTILSKGSADSIVIPDTFGVLSPQGIYQLIMKIKKLTDLPIEVHCHNSMGLGTANALSGVEAGAQVVHTCVNGLGEMAGNTPLEEIALGLRLLMGIETGVDFKKTADLCRLVSRLSNIPLYANKPLVGERSFAIEAGISVNFDTKMIAMGLMDPSQLYPAVVGNVREYVIGKKSGKQSIEYKLAKLNMPPVSEDMLAKILDVVKNRAVEQKGPIGDDQFRKIVEECGKI